MLLGSRTHGGERIMHNEDRTMAYNVGKTVLILVGIMLVLITASNLIA